MKRYAVSPVDVAHRRIKKGERYLITTWHEESDMHPYGAFHITVSHYDYFCLTNGECAFLDGECWTIIEEEEPSDD